MKWLSLLFILAGIGAGCAPTVVLRPNYDLRKIQRAAMLRLDDFHGSPGSGEQVSALLEKSFLQTDFQLVERRQVEAVLKEQAFQHSGSIDPATIKKLGHLLGVDALITGSVTTFLPERHSIAYLEISEVTQVPIMETIIERVKKNNVWVDEPKEIIKGYKTVHTVTKTPQNYKSGAEVAVALRMVDVQTGEIIWVASTLEEGLNTQVAGEILASRIGKSVRKLTEKSKKNTAP